ncbi:rhamnogalacturonate lyase A [Phytophthora nicotianae]|uniref:Rhamnogalacturonate lyase A n=1 Tax=Phytophthora nicotianae TaxID=4792 RepID=A0A0W8CZP1_PHYNI|nr:rhamnogalacturonate lyase A [Phytophthora nicotianae]
MRVAVAGTGSFAKHFIDELPAAGHEIVVLTRSHKDFLDGKKGLVEQRVTDYSSVSQLVEVFKDCDALVSTIADLQHPDAEIHLTLLEACKQSPKCKRFIPSEYGVNPEDTDTCSMFQHNRRLKKTLRAQTEVEWTFIAIGYLMDYIVPSTNRNHPSIGPIFALDLEARTMTIPGTGNDVFSTTSARDVAKVIAELLKSTNKWRPYTYVQGMQTTWLQLAELVKTVGGVSDLKVSFEPIDEIKAALEKKESPQAALLAEFKMLVPSGRCTFDQEKVKRDRVEHFPNVHLRTAQELLEEVKQDPTVII